MGTEASRLAAGGESEQGMSSIQVGLLVAFPALVIVGGLVMLPMTATRGRHRRRGWWE
jgi:hypothetical protein